MRIDPERRLYVQLESLLGKNTDFWRLIPVGPWEIRTIFSPLKLKRGSVPSPPLPYSIAQLKKLAEQLEEEESQAILTLDLPEIGGQPLNLYSFAKWFGDYDQDPSFGKIWGGYLNLSGIIPSFDQWVKELGAVCDRPQWRIRYLNLPHWGANKTYQDQKIEVKRRGYLVPSAISDIWSMLLARTYATASGNETWILRTDHCGRTSTVLNNEPIVVYNMAYGLGLHFSGGVSPTRVDAGTYICCEIPPF